MCLSVPGLLTVYPHSSTPSTPGTVVTIASPLLPAGHSTSDKNSQDMPDSHYPQVKCAFFIASLPRCLHLSTVNCQLVTGNCDRFSCFYVLSLYHAPPSLSVSVSVNFFSYFLSLLLLLPLPSSPPSPFPRFPSLSLDHRPLSPSPSVHRSAPRDELHIEVRRGPLTPSTEGRYTGGGGARRG